MKKEDANRYCSPVKIVNALANAQAGYFGLKVFNGTADHLTMACVTYLDKAEFGSSVSYSPSWLWSWKMMHTGHSEVYSDKLNEIFLKVYEINNADSQGWKCYSFNGTSFL